MVAVRRPSGTKLLWWLLPLLLLVCLVTTRLHMLTLKQSISVDDLNLAELSMLQQTQPPVETETVLRSETGKEPKPPDTELEEPNDDLSVVVEVEPEEETELLAPKERNDDPTVVFQNETHHACRIDNETQTLIRAPHFMIIGAQKAGTSAIAKLFRLHPKLHDSDRFEPHLFDWLERIEWPLELLTADQIRFQQQRKKRKGDTSNDEDRICRVRKKYAGYFTNYTQKVEQNMTTVIYSYEKTPDYLPNPSVPALVQAVCRPWKPKLLVVLRDPVERVYSLYRMYTFRYKTKYNVTSFEQLVQEEITKLRDNGLITAPLPPTDNTTIYDDSLDLFAPPNLNETRLAEIIQVQKVFKSPIFYSIYVYQLRQWLNFFPLANTSTPAPPFSIKVIRYEDFKENKAERLKEILTFVMGPDASDADLNFYTRNDKAVAALEKDFSPSFMGASRKKDNYFTPMPAYLEQYLQRLYKPYNDQLADLLGEEWRDVWKPSNSSSQ